ncbi:hypothetical protein SUDANB120_06143 [Streptomyces sp. enrichment culture]
MSLNDLLHADLGILAVIPHLLLVLTVLISPGSSRGKTARTLLAFPPTPRRAPTARNSRKPDHPAAAPGPNPDRGTSSTPMSRRRRLYRRGWRNTPP